MIILQANKIERSFAGDVLFDNINLQVDERDRIALVGKNGAGKSTLLKILVGEEEPTSGEINKKKDVSLSYLAQDSRFESENTIYNEMLHVFDDLRRAETQLRQMELEMGEKYGEDLDKLMADYDRLLENFRQAGGLPTKLISALSSMVSSLMNLCGRRKLLSFQVVKILVWHWLKCSLKSPNSWSWTSLPTTWIFREKKFWKKLSVTMRERFYMFPMTDILSTKQPQESWSFFPIVLIIISEITTIIWKRRKTSEATVTAFKRIQCKTLG